MKKIIMAVAAVAMAASLFAADVSAGTKIEGSLFGLGADKKLTLLKEGNGTHDYANPNFAFNVADDKAGASVKITTQADKDPVLAVQTIWFKPFDLLKVTVGTLDVALNKETIDWTESITDLAVDNGSLSGGVMLTVDVSGFALDVGFDMGAGNNWLEKADGADPVIAPFFIKAGYNADFGSVGAYVKFNKQTKWWGCHVPFYNIYEGAKGPITNVDFGAGYKGSFGGINAFVQAAAHVYDGQFKWIRPEVFVNGGFDAFGFALFAAPGIYLDGKDANCEIVAKLTYGLGGVTPYVYFKDADILAKTFASTVKLGATGSVGLMGWNTWVQMDITGNEVAVSVPFELTVSF